MQILATGTGELFQPFDMDGFRDSRRRRDRSLADKRTTVAEAIRRHVPDGCYLGVGGFGANRIPTALLHEIVRQRRKNLGLSGHTATHDCQILAAGECFDRCDIAYAIGLEARGLSPQSRRLFQSGKVKMCEWSNAALAWRYRAAAMGVPFLPARVMAGTDTFARSAAKMADCPFSGRPVVLLPALSPDVALIHVHRADAAGNCEIEGILVADPDLARASQTVLVTCEQLVDTDYFRSQPGRTHIPWFCVDAVIEVPFGSFPGNMAGCYYSDEAHLKQWLAAEADPATLATFVDEYIHSCPNFEAYLAKCGGAERLAELGRLERLEGQT